MLAMEKEMTGLYLSGHPLMEYRDELEAGTTINTSEIHDAVQNDEGGISESSIELDNRIVTMGGILASVRIKATKSNNIMAFAVLEDMFGSIEVLIFPKVYEKYNKLVQEDNLCLIRGRLSIREDEEPKLLAEEIKPLKKFEDSDSRELGKKLYLKIPMDRSGEMINAIKPILASKKGTTPVYLCIQDDKSSIKPKHSHTITHSTNRHSEERSPFRPLFDCKSAHEIPSFPEHTSTRAHTTRR
jgi:DNA polymerase-3 subunit alpha